MNTLLVFGRLYNQLDASLGRMLPEHVRLWLRGVIIAVARIVLPSKLGRFNGMPGMLPAWACAAVSEAAINEPELSPKLLVPYLRHMRIPTGNIPLAVGYGRLWERIDKRVRHVFVLGDADGQISNLLRGAIRELAAKRTDRVLVIWTGPSAAFPEDLLAPAQLLNLKSIGGAHRPAEQALMLGRALIELKPVTIHIASSDIAWVMFKIVATALGECSRLYAEVSSIGMRTTEDGVSEAERSIASGLPSMVKLIVRSRETIEQLVTHLGIDRAAIELGLEGDPGVTELGSVERDVGFDWLSNLPGYFEQ